MAQSRKLSVPDQHRLRIARDTLRMPDAMARVMGGMTKDEARRVIRELTAKKNPHGGKYPGPFVPDEGPAEHIRNALQILTLAEEVQGYHQDAVFERDDLIAVKQRLEKALAQVEDLRVYMGLPRKPNSRSVRRGNPALMVLGNPRVEDATVATWAKIEYMRPDDPDGTDVVRVHEFKDGFEIGWLSDGTVQLSHPKHPLWMDDENDEEAR